MQPKRVLREKGEDEHMFGSKFGVSALVVAALAFAAIPIAVAVDSVTNSDDGLVTISGTVKAFVCCDDDENETCDNCTNDRAGAFILEKLDGEEVLVEFGPWWYWDWVADNNGTTVRDVIAVGDRANVTGDLETEDDGTVVLGAWKITNSETGQEVTIKEEACPPWAGGPKELGINPWPPSHEDE
jgi:hypothetical protein